MTKNVYCYNPATKEFTGVEIADKCQIEENTWHKPGFSTYYKPPQVGTDQIAVFRQDAAAMWDDGEGIWEVKPDFRGNMYFSITNGEPLKIEEIGVVPDPLVHTVKPMPSPQHTYFEGEWIFDQAKQLTMMGRVKTLELRKVNLFFTSSINRMYGGTQQIEKDTWQTKLSIAHQILSGDKWDEISNIFLENAEINTVEERSAWARNVIAKNKYWVQVIGLAEKHRTQGRNILRNSNDLMLLKSQLTKCSVDAEAEIAALMVNKA